MLDSVVGGFCVTRTDAEEEPSALKSDAKVWTKSPHAAGDTTHSQTLTECNEPNKRVYSLIYSTYTLLN